MPLIKSAIKRMRQSAKARVRNSNNKRSLKTAVKAFTADVSIQNLQKAQSHIDKAVKKNLLNKKTAARRKAQLFARAKAAGVKLAVGAKVAPKTVAKKVIKAAPKAVKAVKKAAVTKKPVAKKPAAKKATPKAKA